MQFQMTLSRKEPTIVIRCAGVKRDEEPDTPSPVGYARLAGLLPIFFSTPITNNYIKLPILTFTGMLAGNALYLFYRNFSQPLGSVVLPSDEALKRGG